MVNVNSKWLLLFYTLIFIRAVYLVDLLRNDEEVEPVIACKNQVDREITTENRDRYEFVEVIEGRTVKLQCRFCFYLDDKKPKNWYYKNISGKSANKELYLDTENNSTISRVLVNNEHTLIIRNVTIKDIGFYTCLHLDEPEEESKFNFLIDVVEFVNVTDQKGDASDWLAYRDDEYAYLNKLFKNANGKEFVRVREKLNLTLEAVTAWKLWGLCDACGRPYGEGIRKRQGFCRINIIAGNKRTERNEKETALVNMYKISCKSLLLKEVFPTIYRMSKLIPNFLLTQKCVGICNPDAEGFYRGWKTTKTGYKYKKTIVLAEDSHLTLICPESSLDNVVKWYFNGRHLPAGESIEPENAHTEPRISVDTFNSLYLHGIRKSEEGNYICLVDDVRMQQIAVFVVSKSKLLSQAMVRHLIYLSFVLCMTLTCYCAGLFVVCKKRRKFKTYEELRLLHCNSEDLFTY